MRFKKAGWPPPELRAWLEENRERLPLEWDELSTGAKTAVRRALHQDQHGLCCYCNRRIQGDDADHVEHIAPQTDENRFDWKNLALACEGGNQSGCLLL